MKRFKTEHEMRTEYGNNWRESNNPSFPKGMDSALGKLIDVDMMGVSKTKNEFPYTIGDTVFSIRDWMLTDNPITFLQAAEQVACNEINADIDFVMSGESNIEKALRYNTGKLQWSLVHFKSMEPMVKVLEFGAKKYAPKNWMKPMDKKVILESMMRHMSALMDGEDVDPESGISHMGHIQCNSMFYNYHYGEK